MNKLLHIVCVGGADQRPKFHVFRPIQNTSFSESCVSRHDFWGRVQRFSLKSQKDRVTSDVTRNVPDLGAR
jgi:hypothetical protein